MATGLAGGYTASACVEEQVVEFEDLTRVTSRTTSIHPRECSLRSSPSPMLEDGIITRSGLGIILHLKNFGFCPCVVPLSPVAYDHGRSSSFFGC